MVSRESIAPGTRRPGARTADASRLGVMAHEAWQAEMPSDSSATRLQGAYRGLFPQPLLAKHIGSKSE